MSKDIHVNRIVRLKEQSRQIVKEIVNFGVTEDQKVKIIHFLSLELESRDDMIDIVNVVKMITERQVESSQSIIIE